MVVRMRSTLVVVALLVAGGMAAGCVPDPTGPTTTTSTTIDIERTCRLEYRTILTALEAARAMTGQYPESVDALSEYLSEPVNPSHWTYSGVGPAGLAGLGDCTGF